MLERIKCFFGFHDYWERKVRANFLGFSGYQITGICRKCAKTFCIFQTDEIVESVKDGDWNDKSTWSTGNLPGPSSKVTVNHNVTICKPK